MENDVQHLIDLLYDMIDNAKGVPLGNDKCIIERNRALDYLDEIRAQLPAELEEAKKLMAARAEYVANAKKEAENLRQRAQNDAKHIVSESERCRPPASRPMILSARRRSVPAKCTALTMYKRRTPSSARKMRCRPRWKKCARPTGSIRISPAAGCRKRSGVRVRRIPLLQKKSKKTQHCCTRRFS